MKNIVINLQRRPDRKQNIEKLFSDLEYTFYPAIDGKQLEPTLNIYNLFKGNDFNWRKGVIGCALSHYNIWNNLVKEEKCDSYCIFEDDITLSNNFSNNLIKCKEFIESNNIDILFLGYHMMKDIRNNLAYIYNSDNELSFHEYNKDLYIGGFFGYIISKNGANKILKYINENGIKRAIDCIINKNLNIYECQPFLIKSDWVDTNNSEIDSNIQKDYDFLKFEGEEFNGIIEIDQNKYLDIKRIHEIEQDWVIVNNLDSYGNDIKFTNITKVEILKELALADPNCIGFNNLGYLKSYISSKESWKDVSNRFPNFKMYINKERYTNYNIKYCIVISPKVLNFFIEIARVFNETLINFGYDSILDTKFHKERTHICFGVNNDLIWDNIPANSKIVNLEQLYDGCVFLNAKYLNFLNIYEVWDYSSKNIEFLNNKNIFNVKKINIGYSKSLEYNIFKDEQDIDVLFLGTPNQRRTDIHNLIVNQTVNENIIFKHNVWGEEKENLIQRSKIILNIHFYDSKILETIRISHLLSNKKCVISEKSGINEENIEWEKGLILCEYNEIVNNVLKYLNDDELRKTQEKQAYSFILSYPQELPIKKQNTDLIYYNGYDSVGYDIKFVGKLPISSLIKIAKEDYRCVGFNTLGFLKYKIDKIEKNKWFGENNGLYLKSKREDYEMIEKLDLTFTITSCKRLKNFIMTVDDFLNKCEDHYLIKEWICIDDNSDKEDIIVMKKKYPFFKFIIKNKNLKGHANSMNILMDNIKTKYVLQYEDDWILENKINIRTIYDFMKDDIIQVKLLNENETKIYQNKEEFTISEKFNPLSKYNLDIFFSENLNLAEKHNLEIYNKIKNKQYEESYWWPGFTLNPSIYNLEILKKIGYFEPRKEFEFLQGVKIFFNNYKIYVYTKTRCLHTGNISAYDLNGGRNG